MHAAAPTQQNVKMPSWEQMHKQLTTQHRLESISPSEAQKLVKSGKFVLVDVRPPDVFEKAHPEGAQSAPLFQSVKWSQPDFKKYLRAIAFMANGVKPVEENTEFLEDLSRVSNGKGVILMCEAGGTTKPSPNFAAGKASRSLKAAWKAVTAGGMPVKHMSGGVYGWYSADLPMFGDYDKSNLGRTPNAAVEPKGQYYEEAQKALEEKRQQEK